MIGNREHQAVCALCVTAGRAALDPLNADDTAKNVSKIYHLAQSLRNRGVFPELAERAEGLAKELGAKFSLVDGDSFLIFPSGVMVEL